MFSEFCDHGFQAAFNNDVSASLPPLFGDFYSGANDVVRGTTIGVNVEFCNPDFDLGLGKPSHPKFMEAIALPPEADFRFNDGNEPRELTPEITAQLEITNLQCSGASSAEVGNKLLSFLRDTVGANVTKVSRAKFTVRAQCFLSGHYCDIKVRVYKQKEPKAAYVLDFQRRRGDATAFCLLFQKANKALQLGIAQGTGLDEKVPVNIPQTVNLPPEQAIAPLLSMAASTQDVNLLAEVASGLSALVNDAQISTALRKPCASTVLQELENINDYRVVVPTSCVLSCVYGHPNNW